MAIKKNIPHKNELLVARSKIRANKNVHGVLLNQKGSVIWK